MNAVSSPLDVLYRTRSCDGFRIVPVYRRLDATLAGRIVNLWERHRLLPEQADPTRRLDTVVCVAFDPFGELAAVNSARRVHLDGRLLFDYRIFIRPRNGVPRLKVEMTRSARELLARVPLEQPPEALLLSFANPRLNRDEVIRELTAAGYRQWLTPRGRAAWLYEFDPSQRL